MRVLEFGARARLTKKPLLLVGCGLTVTKHLECDRSIEKTVTHQPDGSHTTNAERSDDVEELAKGGRKWWGFLMHMAKKIGS